MVDKDPSEWCVILVSKKGSVLFDSISTVNCMLWFQWSLGVGGSARPCLGVELLVCHPHTFSRKDTAYCIHTHAKVYIDT